MLTIFGPQASPSGYCDGVSRREFLKIGTPERSAMWVCQGNLIGFISVVDQAEMGDNGRRPISTSAEYNLPQNVAPW